MAATFTAPETQQKTKCAVKQINLDKNNENIQSIAQVNKHVYSWLKKKSSYSN